VTVTSAGEGEGRLVAKAVTTANQERHVLAIRGQLAMIVLTKLTRHSRERPRLTGLGIRQLKVYAV
jgi:hypothetical protein